VDKDKFDGENMFREIVRKKQCLSQEKIIEILRTEKRGVLSVMGDNGYPYGVPINYWYNEENGKLYFHSGKAGHKVDAMAKNKKVSFCVYDSGYRKEGEWALNISSVIVFGEMHIVENYEDAMTICKNLSLKYTTDIAYIESEIQKFGKSTMCYELRPKHITGKIVNES
jgi:nitroimidazol reductase NimA-like FMN-containing flavoprotein (pyridoxamine 5'-phosphate oxidase superfamily)